MSLKYFAQAGATFFVHCVCSCSNYTVFHFFQAMRSCQSMVVPHKVCPTLKPLPFSRGFVQAKLTYMLPEETGVTQSKSHF